MTRKPVVSLGAAVRSTELNHRLRCGKASGFDKSNCIVTAQDDGL